MNKMYLVSISMIIFLVGTIQTAVHEIINNSGKNISITFYSTSPRGNAQHKVDIKPGTNSYDAQEKCLQKIVIFEDGNKKLEERVMTCNAAKITVDKHNSSWKVTTVKK